MYENERQKQQQQQQLHSKMDGPKLMAQERVKYLYEKELCGWVSQHSITVTYKQPNP